MIKEYFNIRYELDPAEVLSAIDCRVAEGPAGYVCVADGNILARVQKDEAYRAVVNGGMFSICDSGWVPLYLKMIYGFRPEQYCGSRIFADVTSMRKYRMLFLGSSSEVLEALRANLIDIDPEIAGMTFSELPFCKVEDFDYEAIASAINADNPDIVWLSLGAPKQEQFAARLMPHLNRGVVIPVGAVFNFRAGLGISRAPAWMVRMRIEFLYRIFSEPRKQLRRCALIIGSLPSTLAAEIRRKKTCNQ